MSGWFLEAYSIMTNFRAKATNSIAKGMNSLAKWMNSIPKVTNLFANGTNLIAKVTNLTCTINLTDFKITKQSNSYLSLCNNGSFILKVWNLIFQVLVNSEKIRI